MFKSLIVYGLITATTFFSDHAKASIPDELTEQVHSTCSQYFGDDFTLAEAVITPLDGGLMTKMYHMKWKGKDYAIRLLEPTTPYYQRKTEVNIAKIAGARFLGPKVYYHDPEYTTVIREFGQGGTYLRSHPNRRIHELASLLRKLHSIPLHETAVLTKVPIWKTMEKRLDEMLATGFPVPPELQEAVTYAKSTSSLLELSDQDTVLCHNDLHCLNILCDGKGVKLIDWALSAHGSRYFDLTHLAVWLAMSEEECEQLLTGYFGREPNEVERAQFALASNLPYLALSVWAFHKFSQEYKGPSNNILMTIGNTLRQQPSKWVAEFITTHGDKQLKSLDQFYLFQVAVGGLKAYRDGVGLSIFTQ